MSLIPIQNPYRTYDNKEVDLVSLLPNHYKDTEVATFLELFEKYLNTMFLGATKYIPPTELTEIIYAGEMIWTNGSQFVTSKDGGMLAVLKPGDWIRRGGETSSGSFYKIEKLEDDYTVNLIKPYVMEIAPAYFMTAYYDNFHTDSLREFWFKPDNGGISPEGMDGTMDGNYIIDKANDSIYFSPTSTRETCTIASKIYGNFNIEVGMKRSMKSQDKKKKFGFTINPTDTDIYGIVYSCIYENNIMSVSAMNNNNTQLISAGSIVLDDNVETWTAKIVKDNYYNTITFVLSSLKPKAGSPAQGNLIKTDGYFNRFEMQIHYTDISPVTTTYIDDSYNENTLKFINGANQGFTYVYFLSDKGFPGEVDHITTTFHDDYQKLPDDNVYIDQFGKNTQEDNETIYAFYQDFTQQLRVRDYSNPPVTSATDFRQSPNYISILEKVRRLTELHDPDLIDIDFIQHFADYLGYSVNINRGTLGIFFSESDPEWSTYTDEQKQEIEDKYLRFVITNLPTWYRIKTTKNALNIMLLSFGLVTEIEYYFCKDYNAFYQWKIGEALLNKDEYQTPHFNVKIDIEGSVSSTTSEPGKMKSIIDAILSVKPINTVFHGLNGWVNRQLVGDYSPWVEMYAYHNQYILIR